MFRRLWIYCLAGGLAAVLAGIVQLEFHQMESTSEHEVTEWREGNQTHFTHANYHGKRVNRPAQVLLVGGGSLAFLGLVLLLFRPARRSRAAFLATGPRDP